MSLAETIADGQLLVASLIALAAGLISFLSPCVLPLVPGYLGYVGASAGSSAGQSVGQSAGPSAVPAAPGDEESARKIRRRMVIGALLFVAGFTAIFVALFALAGGLGPWIVQWEDPITRVMGAIIIVMALVFMGFFGGMQRTAKLKIKPRLGIAGAPLLGAVFAIGWTPCTGPTLAVIGTLALQGGSAGRGAWLAVVYALGLGIPFVLAALGFGWMATATTFFKRHIRAVNLIGGGLLLIIGILMVTGVWIRMMYAMQAVISGFVPAL